MLAYGLAVLGAAGCNDPRAPVSTGDDATTSAPPSESTSTTAAADDDSGTASVEPTGSAFLGPELDLGGAFECDVFAQDCLVGHKCMPWGNDGGTWNATRCSPIADEPAGEGESCHVVGSGTSGLDDCDLGLMCWYVDPRSNEGICEDFCVGSEVDLYCDDPDEWCNIGGNGDVVFCETLCNPLAQDCGDGQTCLPYRRGWVCAPDGSGDLGSYGDPCAFIDACDPGLICMDADAVPPGLPCEGVDGCCTELCDITDPAGDRQCSGAAGGQTCQPWYDRGEAPLLVEHVGMCALP